VVHAEDAVAHHRAHDGAQGRGGGDARLEGDAYAGRVLEGDPASGVDGLGLGEQEGMLFAGGLSGIEPLEAAGGGRRPVVDGDGAGGWLDDEEGPAEDVVRRSQFPGFRAVDGRDFQVARVEDQLVAGEEIEVDFGRAFQYLSAKIDAEKEVEVADAGGVGMGERVDIHEFIL